MPDVAKLRATVELDDSKFRATAAAAEQTMQKLGTEAGKAGGAVTEMGAALDTAGAEGALTFGQAVKTGATAPLIAMSAEAVKATATVGTLGTGLTQASSSFSTVGASAGNVKANLAAVSAEAAKVEASVAGMGGQVEEAGGQLEHLNNQGNKTVGTMEKLRAAFKAVDGTALKEVGQGLTIGVTAPLTALAVGSVKAAADLDSLKRGLTAVTHSSAEADRQFAHLKEVAKAPGLGFEEAAKGMVNLQAAGLSATQAEGALKAFGNALATVGRGKHELDLVQFALGQIASSSKLSGQDLRQLTEQVPQLRQELVKLYGTADPEAIGKKGVSSQQFISDITAQLAKLPQVTGGIKNDMENMSDTIQQSFGKVGAALVPVTSSIVGGLAPALEGAADGFSKLSPFAQSTVIGLAAITAAAGPANYIVGSLAEGSKNLGKAWGELTKLGEAVVGAFSAKAGAATAAKVAVDQETLATGENALAAKADTGATADNTKAKAVNATAQADNAIAVKADTAALWDQAAVLKANSDLNNSVAVPALPASVAKGAAVGAAPGFLARVGAGARTLGAMNVGTLAPGALAYGAHLIKEQLPDDTSNQGKHGLGGFVADVATGAGAGALPASLAGPWGTAAGAVVGGVVGAWRNLTGEQARAAGDPEARKAEMEKNHQEERARLADLKQQHKVAVAMDEAKVQAAEAEMFRAEVDWAQAKVAGLAEEGKHAAELAALTPILAARQKQLATEAAALEPKIKEDAEARKDYWHLQQEAAHIEEQLANLRVAAVKEQAAATKKAREMAGKLVAETWKAAEEGALARATVAGDDYQNRAKATELTPVLSARQKQLTDELAALQPQIAGSNEAREEYLKKQRELYELQAKGNELWKAATKEQVAQERKVRESQEKAGKAQLDAMVYRAQTMAAAAPEGERARAEAAALGPVLEEQERQILATMQGLKPDTEAYWTALKEVSQTERQLQELQNKAAQEQQAQVKVGIAAAKKALEDTKAANREHRELLSAQQGLLEAKLGNNPFLNDKQRKRALVPLLMEQLKEQLRPVVGESEIEQLRRATTAEQLKGQIIADTGFDMHRKRRVGGVPREVAALYNQFAVLEQQAALDPWQSVASARALKVGAPTQAVPAAGPATYQPATYQPAPLRPAPLPAYGRGGGRGGPEQLIIHVEGMTPRQVGDLVARELDREAREHTP